MPFFAIFLSFVLIAGESLLGQQAVISEFLADNETGLKDEDGDRSDWIEIHNPTGQLVDISGWYLSDDSANLAKWQFPTPTHLLPGGYLLVWASGKDRSVPLSTLHTNFKLSNGGEFLGLTQADGVTISHSFHPVYPEQHDDVSYGLSFNPTVTSATCYFAPTTPSGPNSVGGPVVFDVVATPRLPALTDDVVITAQAMAGSGTSIAMMTLRWKVMFQNLQSSSMRDDGLGYDSVAGDGIYTAHIPAGTASSLEMVRWKVETVDSAGQSARLPLYLDAMNSPEFFGTVVDEASISSAIPVYHWYTESPNAANQTSGTRSSLMVGEEFYDNIFTRKRGGSSASWPKKSYKFDFNTGDRFRFDETEGRVEEFNLNQTWSDKAYFRRVLCWEVYQAAGLVSSLSFPIRLQQNGAFHSLTTFVEQPDADLLSRNDLDEEGALYKMYNTLNSAYAGVEKKTRKHEGNSDLQNLVTGCRLNGTALDNYLFDNVDLPAVLNYIAATTIIQDNDHVHKNYYVWRDSDGDQEWRFLPWDKDLTLGRNYTFAGGVLNDTIHADDDPFSHPLFGDAGHPKNDGYWNRLVDACHRSPVIREMYLRRLRTLMDELLQSPTTPTANLWFDSRVDELVAQCAPELALDEQKWGIPTYGSSRDVYAAVARMKSAHLAVRRHHLYNTHGPSGGGMIPGPAQTLHIGIGAVEHSPVSGNQEEEYVQLYNTNNQAVDISGWRLSGGVEFTFDGGSVIPAGGSAWVSPDLLSFRARATGPTGGESRLVLGPYEGHMAPTESLSLFDQNGDLVDSFGTTPSLVVRDLEAGETASLWMLEMTPGGDAGVGVTLAGLGSTSTPWGTCSLAQPIRNLGAATANQAGFASMSIPVPVGLAGVRVWLQALDLQASQFTATLEMVVQ
ncbi:MAG: CotH kinase family protein [Planctomycetes bacterium]|nr:CotH kinase family protein [Planctomycetota bacterium]